jgi:tetratricopeptide (TPR) repeat protein
VGSEDDDTLVGTGGAGTPDPRAPVHGDRIGRFVLLRRLGAGGMGVVHAAYDPELDRQVALKLLHPGEPGRREAARARRRIVREAQAMAKVVHANVVTIHDVGTHEDQVYIAMEHVDGHTLRAELERQPPWPRVLELLLAAGRGLAAAHAKGLVHRDFKPDNVMLAEDGRVLVMDFGLALATGGDASSSSSSLDATGEPAPSVERSPVVTEATWAGAQAGTPAYMAPEQLDPGVVDARADQFAFCVTLWEGVYGERPFAGSTVFELATNVAAGRVREPPRGKGVPPGIRRVLERGLRVDRERRWPDLSTLLAALERAALRARRRRAVIGLGVAGLVVAAGLGVRQWHVQQRVAACEAEGERVRETWPGRSAAVEAAMLAAGDPEGSARVAARLGEWAVAWERARAAVCVGAEVEGTLSQELHTRGTSCLALQRTQVETTLGLVEAGDAKAIRNAAASVAGLDAPQRCTDPVHLSRETWPEPEQVAAVVALRHRLAKAHALRFAGKYEDGLAMAEAAEREAEALGWLPLRAEALVVCGELAFELGRYPEAVEGLRRAYFTAGRHGADAVAMDAASELVYVLGQGQADLDAAIEWGEHATMLVERLGDADDEHGATLWARLSGVHWARGDFAAARALVERALAIRQRLTPDHPAVASYFNNLGNILADSGDYPAAEVALEKALTLREHHHGAHHPVVASSLNNLGGVNHSQGKFDVAIGYYERALAIKERTLGPEHPELAPTLNNLAGIAVAQERFEDAHALFERVLQIRRKALGPEHPRVANALDGVGMLLAAEGKLEEARQMHERALTMAETALGPEHPQVGQTLQHLGEVLAKQGKLAEARTRLERALAIREAKLGKEHPDTAKTRTLLEQLALHEAVQ